MFVLCVFSSLVFSWLMGLFFVPILKIYLYSAFHHFNYFFNFFIIMPFNFSILFSFTNYLLHSFKYLQSFTTKKMFLCILRTFNHYAIEQLWFFSSFHIIFTPISPVYVIYFSSYFNMIWRFFEYFICSVQFGCFLLRDRTKWGFFLKKK